ncbi:hypothetical protein [Gordonia sihwensis]|uniref:hypothetical protein n=1 Tax=Gordonia sihwensis TaxID=173559 RepID=UPI003D96CDD5
MATSYKSEHGERVIGTPRRRNDSGDLVRVDIWIPNDGREMYLPEVHVANLDDASDTHAEKGLYAADCLWCRREEPHTLDAHDAQLDGGDR